ncbi:MAG: carboxypeptidase regulatory-like domain-containing protein [Terracidiphilus sp.]
MRRWLSFALALVSVTAVAQQSSEIAGTVRDHNGRPIAGARVAVSNAMTGSEVDAYTQTDGTYRVKNLPPMSYYSAEASHNGFIAAVHQNLVLPAGSALSVDFALSPASVLTMPASGTLMYFAMTALLSSLVGALVLMMFTEPSKKLFQALGQLCMWAWDKAYELLAPRFPNAVGLRGYRKRVQRSELARIEHPVGPGESDGVFLTLDQAFAPLAVIAEDGEDRTDLFPFASSHQRFLVLGGPGTGKTTLMKSLIISVLKKETSCDDLNSLVPVFVVLREMSSSGQTVEQAVVNALGRLRFKKAEKFVSSALEGGRLLIVLDGLDEVGTNRDSVSGKIRAFCHADDQRERRNRLILTCRENSYRTRDLADVVSSVTRVEPFSPQHMRAFLQGWPPHNGRVALSLYPQIQEDPQTLDACRNPLLLTLLTGLYLTKEKFDLPTSREAFYCTAIDELLVQRPARKQQSQIYSPEQKRPILQRIALDRLETVGRDDDPELLSRDRLFEFAKQVLGGDLKEVDFQKLLTELDTVNSIIKSVQDEGYVFGHRTFQEYLAAQEANRTRTEDEVINRFGTRIELSEVLCFYCGLIKKIPTIEKILKAVLAKDPTLAGRCLLNTLETPSSDTVVEIAEALYSRVKKQKNYVVELDLLASLARRPAIEFESARKRFSSAVDIITKTTGQGAAGFVSALSGNPSLARTLVPGLLAHRSPNWRIQAVELLHNLGTDDAVQELVQIVNSGGNPEREWAAIWVANLIKTRNLLLRRMAELFPPYVVNRLLWPFEEYFPGRIAVPLINAIRTGDATAASALQNRCVIEAVSRQGTAESMFKLHLWRRVSLYRKLNQVRRRLAVLGSKVALVAVSLIIAMAVAAQMHNGVKHTITLVQPWPPYLAKAPVEASLAFREAAQKVQNEIMEKYPPKPLGVARLWPPNWEAKPSVPSDEKATAAAVKEYSYSLTPPSGVSWNDLGRHLASLHISLGLVAELETTGQRASQLRPTSSNFCFYIVGRHGFWQNVLALVIPLGFVIYTVLLFRQRRRKQAAARHRAFSNAVMATNVLFITISNLAITKSQLIPVLAVPAVVAAAAIGILGDSSELPPNPYMQLINELGSRDREDDEGATTLMDETKLAASA